MMKKLLLLAAMVFALTSAVSADMPMPPCIPEGTCRADVR